MKHLGLHRTGTKTRLQWLTICKDAESVYLKSSLQHFLNSF